MNEDNMNQVPNTGNGYPQSGAPYPQSGAPYPQSGAPYPQSGAPYPQSETPYEEKKSNVWQIAVVAVVAVLIVALATTLIVVLQRRNNQPMGGDWSFQQPGPPPDVAAGGVMLNGRPAEFEVILENGKTYLPAKELSAALSYDYVEDGNLIKIISPTEIAVLELDKASVTREDQTTGVTTSSAITTAPFERDGVIYIYSRDLSFILPSANVSYDTRRNVVEINIGGGPMGPPPGGPMGPAPGSQPQTQPQPQIPDELPTEPGEAAPEQSEIAPQPPQGGGQPPRD